MDNNNPQKLTHTVEILPAQSLEDEGSSTHYPNTTAQPKNIMNRVGAIFVHAPTSLPPLMDHKKAAKEFFASYRRFKEAIEQLVNFKKINMNTIQNPYSYGTKKGLSKNEEQDINHSKNDPPQINIGIYDFRRARQKNTLLVDKTFIKAIR
ncbi:14166_t:CDS:2, partial [Cetraspora pellucida]